MMPARQHICGLSFGTCRRLLLFVELQHWWMRSMFAHKLEVEYKKFPVCLIVRSEGKIDPRLQLHLRHPGRGTVAAADDDSSPPLRSGSSQRWVMGGLRRGKFTPSCQWGGRAWSFHAWINTIKSALAPPSLPSSHTMPPLSLLIPHHCIIVSGRATRLVDTQSGKRGAMMNCSLLVLSTMIIINFPPALAGEWGPENCSVTAPPPWAVTEPPIITYHRQRLGPRLKRWWKWKALVLKCPVFLCLLVFELKPILFPVLSSFSF